MKTYSESRIKLQNLQLFKKILEISNQFLPSEQPCEPKSLDVVLKIAGGEKIRSENMRLWSTWRPFDRVLNERSASDGGNLCSLWLVILKSSEIISETPFSCDTVGRKLLCPETDWNIRKGKQGFMFILTDFKNARFDVSFPTSISVSTIILRLRKVEFFQHINVINILFIRFVKFGIKQWFSAYQRLISCLVWSCSTADWDFSSIFLSHFLLTKNCLIHSLNEDAFLLGYT